MNPSIFNTFRMTVAEKNLHVYSIYAYQKELGEAAHHFRTDDKICAYSASKTFASVGAGIAQDEGLFRLTDFVLDFFPEYKNIAAPGTERITLRDLLHMASGKNAVFLFGGGTYLDTPKDWMEIFCAAPVVATPSECFSYNNSCTYVIGRVIEKMTGQNLRDYLVPRLFQPFGIFNPQWHTDPQGHTLAATELYLSAQELHQMGLLLLGKGCYQGKQLVSADYVQAMHTDLIDTKQSHSDPDGQNGYGYQIWRCQFPNAYRADGMYGQYSIVFPDQEAVVTVTAHEPLAGYEITRAIYTDIIPQISACSADGGEELPPRRKGAI